MQGQASVAASPSNLLDGNHLLRKSNPSTVSSSFIPMDEQTKTHHSQVDKFRLLLLHSFYRNLDKTETVIADPQTDRGDDADQQAVLDHRINTYSLMDVVDPSQQVTQYSKLHSDTAQNLTETPKTNNNSETLLISNHSTLIPTQKKRSTSNTESVRPNWLKTLIMKDELKCNQTIEGRKQHKSIQQVEVTKKRTFNLNASTPKKKASQHKNVPNIHDKGNSDTRTVTKKNQTFNEIMLDLFKEKKMEVDRTESTMEESLYLRITKSINRFTFWWTKWKKQLSVATIHHFLKSYDPIMRTFECILLFFDTFNFPLAVRDFVQRIRHFLYLLFQFVWTSLFLLEENPEAEREILMQNSYNDSQIYNTDPYYYYDDVNYYQRSGSLDMDPYG